jgi:GNAT superfamily N-acetyltransferase
VTQVSLRDATSSRAASWLDGWRARLGIWYGRVEVSAEWAAGQVEGRIAGHEAAAASERFAITAAGQVVGILAASAGDEGGRKAVMLDDIWVEPQYRGHGYAADALRQAEAWARAQDAAAMWALTDPANPAHAALFSRYPVRAHQMIKRITGRERLAEGLWSRPMTEPEFADWRARGIADYAAQRAESGLASAAAATADSAAQYNMLLPDGLATANHTFLCLCAGDQVVATIWTCHHRAPRTSWVYDVEVGKQHRGKGFGRAAMIAGENATLDGGDTQLALNVFGQNSVAIRLYTSMGYRAYDHARSIELEQIQP